ncbi:MAG: HAMP domain-containing histidine kinase, partial [Elusimicrobia bacterium]|nr:HAMP domain-containing histidine kinase [Elusimicrobiota bacterium]
ILIIFIVAGLSTIFFIFEKDRIIKETESNQTALMESFRKTCQEAAATHNDLLLLDFMDSMKVINESVVHAVYIDKNMRVRTINEKRYINSIIKKIPVPEKEFPGIMKKTYTVSNDEELIELFAPVFIKGERDGIARIGFSKSFIDKKIKSILMKISFQIALVSLSVLFLGIIGAMFLANKLVKPIKQLATGAGIIGDGNLNYTMRINGPDELTYLSEELNEMANKLKNADMLKTEFISSISHEMKSPLSAIEGYLELLSEDIEKKKVVHLEQTKAMKIIRKNVERLRAFINSILDLSKLTAGQIETIEEEVNMNNIIKETLSGFLPLVKRKNIKIEFDLEYNIASVISDEVKLKQVVSNLLNNAIKFTDHKGTITLQTRNEKDHVKVIITDTGPGITPEIHKEVFEKFYQVYTRKEGREYKGTGLGLSIAKGFVELLGGKIWLESPVKNGKGSRFVFIVPLKKDSDSNKISEVKYG